MNNKKKVLIASGCSFTAYTHCWPAVLQKKYDLDLVNRGVGSQGNSLISKKVIASVDELIREKGHNPEEILVGIMWSGIDRADRYIEGGDMFIGPPYTPESPTAVKDDRRNWRIMNPNWTTSEDCMQWYRIFNNSIESTIDTLEHILRIQWYLDKLGIKYFMTTYMDIWIDSVIKDREVNYLWNLVDWTKFLPVTGCYEWVMKNYEFDGFKPPDKNGWRDQHPTHYGQQKFTEEVIIPFIEKNNIV